MKKNDNQLVAEQVHLYRLDIYVVYRGIIDVTGGTVLILFRYVLL